MFNKIEWQREHRKLNRPQYRVYERTYRARHRDKMRAKHARYYAKNRTAVLARQAIYSQAHRTEIVDRVRRWRIANPEKCNTINANRRAREAGAHGSHTAAEWEALKIEYDFTCPGCGRKEPHIKLTRDHIIPLARGGSNDIRNIQPLCGKCNCHKHAKMPEPIAV